MAHRTPGPGTGLPMNPTHRANAAPAVRLAHLSDVHITARPLGWRRPDWFTKRFPGWINYRWLGRAYRFRQADEVLVALLSELRARPPDRIIFSGDATALGFEVEFGRAAALLRLDDPEAPPGLAVAVPPLAPPMLFAFPSSRVIAVVSALSCLSASSPGWSVRAAISLSSLSRDSRNSASVTS